jgi:hypothetical protein
MEGLLAEMEASSKKALKPDEKLHALNADVAQWNKAKIRVHYALPKAKEFIHRATWALAKPERKALGELYKTHIEPHVPFPEMDQVLHELEHLLKDRQVLSAQGVTVYQECQVISTHIQGALRTLQTNAAARARAKRDEARKKGKFF